MSIKKVLGRYAKITLLCSAIIIMIALLVKIATSSCNPISDWLHKTLTNKARKKRLIKNKDISCFIINPDGTKSEYYFLKLDYLFTSQKYNHYSISYTPNQAQKDIILDILQAKSLPASLIHSIRIFCDQSEAPEILKNLKVSLNSKDSREYISLEDFLKNENTDIGSLACHGGFYTPTTDYIYIIPPCIEDKEFILYVSYAILHELTHYTYLIGHAQCANLAKSWAPWSSYILSNTASLYAEEYRADLQSLKLMNCKKCIKNLSIYIQRWDIGDDERHKEIASGYATRDQEFVNAFLAHHPNMPETCRLCCDK